MLLFSLFAFFVSVHSAPQYLSRFDHPATEHIENIIQKTLHEEFDSERANFYQVDPYDSQFNKQFNNHATVYYQIGPNFTQSDSETILKSLAHYAERTCLTFKEVNEVSPTSGKIYGFIFASFPQTSPDEPIPVDCDVISFVNRNIAGSMIMLNEKSCLNGIGRVNQLIYRSLGFISENLRPIRDEYVTVLWENIKPEYQDRFFKEDYEDDYFKNFDYDYLSVSHYYPDEFSKNGKRTLVSKNPKQRLKKNIELSSSDVLKINEKYCPKNTLDANVLPQPIKTVD